MRGIWKMKNGKLAVVTSEAKGVRCWRGALLFPVTWNRQGWFAELRQGSVYDLAEQIVPIDDFLPVSDLLEEHGFDEVAKFLRTLATAGEESSSSRES